MAAPKGNKNALKHGLYANRFHDNEVKRLNNIPVKNIEGEIAYLRTVLSRIAMILEKTGLGYGSQRPLEDETIKLLHSFTEASRSLSTYIRLYTMMTGELEEWEKEIEEGKSLARLDLGIYDYFNFTPD